jgi:hypothetical protein
MNDAEEEGMKFLMGWLALSLGLCACSTFSDSENERGIKVQREAAPHIGHSECSADGLEPVPRYGSYVAP